MDGDFIRLEALKLGVALTRNGSPGNVLAAAGAFEKFIAGPATRKRGQAKKGKKSKKDT